MRKKKKPKTRRKTKFKKAWLFSFKEMGLVFTKRHKIVVACEECGATWDIEFSFDEDTPKTSYLCPNKCNHDKLGLDASGENTDADNEMADEQG